MTLEIHVMTKDRHICGAVKPVYGIPTGWSIAHSWSRIDYSPLITHGSTGTEILIVM
jgi:hypothetical protein